jgi:NAD(P)-dependent dehydrogenase (short-subunit alcohol dehydrogenase family)
MELFKNRVVVVTGAAQGIGEATAKLFSKGGASVAIFDYNKDKAHQTAEEILGSGGQAIAIACDVTNKEQVESGMEAVAKEFGRLDILVNNDPG